MRFRRELLPITLLGLLIAHEAMMDAQDPIRLWEGSAPGAHGREAADVPSVTVFPASGNPTRTGVLVVPGGAYRVLARGKEGMDAVTWLNAHGIAAFLLSYRLGPGYRYPTQMQDATRALRLVRSRATEFDIDVNQIGMWGFSAGAHVSSYVATHFDEEVYPPVEGIDHVSSRPDFLVLAYPIIDMHDDLTHKPSRDMLLGEHPDAAEIEKLSNQLHVSAQTPPTFIYQTSDDPLVPVQNSIVFYLALRQAGVPVEMHLFEHGNHASGMGGSDAHLKLWPSLALQWMQAHGWAGANAFSVEEDIP